MEQTTDGETLILHQQRQSEAKADVRYQEQMRCTKNMTEQLAQITQLLRGQEKITDLATIEAAYHLLSDAIWDGRLAEVHRFLPLLAEKSFELEQAIKIMLSVLSDDRLSITDPLESCSKIEDSKLRDDVFRLLILENHTQPDKLAPFVGSITDPTLQKIVAALVDGHMEQVITRSETEEQGIIRRTIGIVDGFESEAWLTHRLCIQTILETSAFGSAEMVRTLAGHANFIDQLHIWTLTFNETVQFSSDGAGVTTAFQKIADEMRAKEPLIKAHKKRGIQSK